jgi:hypothetical protein
MDERRNYRFRTSRRCIRRQPVEGRRRARRRCRLRRSIPPPTRAAAGSDSAPLSRSDARSDRRRPRGRRERFDRIERNVGAEVHITGDRRAAEREALFRAWRMVAADDGHVTEATQSAAARRCRWSAAISSVPPDAGWPAQLRLKAISSETAPAAARRPRRRGRRSRAPRAGRLGGQEHRPARQDDADELKAERVAALRAGA